VRLQPRSPGSSSPKFQPKSKKTMKHLLHALTAEYNKKMLESGISYSYGDGKTPVNEEHRTWSNAAG
jgi:hypothetical protein